MSRNLHYTHAVVHQISDSFEKTSLEQKPDQGAISLKEARRQHGEYVQTLKDLGLNVTELPPNEEFPDSVFVEDMAVICEKQALITKPGHPTRKGEIPNIRNALANELGLEIIEIEDPEVSLDGGDVLFTGKEFFVGISKRTNEAAARAIAKAFPAYSVTPVNLDPKKVLHLKEFLTVAGPDTLVVSEKLQEEAKIALRESKHKYRLIAVPDMLAANCLYVNGTLLIQADYPDSIKILEKEVSCPTRTLLYKELSKASGCLTCCSLLINKS